MPAKAAARAMQGLRASSPASRLPQGGLLCGAQVLACQARGRRGRMRHEFFPARLPPSSPSTSSPGRWSLVRVEPSVIEQSRSLTFDEKDQGAPQGAFFIACQKTRGMTHDHVTWHSNDHRRTSRHPAHPGRTLPELASSKRALKKSLSRRCGARTPLSRRPAAAKSSARCGPSTTRPGGLAA